MIQLITIFLRQSINATVVGIGNKNHWSFKNKSTIKEHPLNCKCSCDSLSSGTTLGFLYLRQSIFIDEVIHCRGRTIHKQKSLVDKLANFIASIVLIERANQKLTDCNNESTDSSNIVYKNIKELLVKSHSDMSGYTTRTL